jgi:Uma2 family endonuclease
MSTVPTRRLTEAEYLQRERAATTKSEFYRGEIFAMTGASRAHNLIAANVTRFLSEQLDDRPCEVYQGDMRVRISPTGLYTYPDVVVACSEPQFLDAEVDTLLNPTVLVEVLSPSTEDYDRGTKFKHYRQLTSLREYLMVSQSEHHAEHYVRQGDDRWEFTVIEGLAAEIALPSINCRLTLAEVYRKVTFVADDSQTADAE